MSEEKKEPLFVFKGVPLYKEDIDKILKQAKERRKEQKVHHPNHFGWDAVYEMMHKEEHS